MMDITLEQIRIKGKKLGFNYVQALSIFLYERIMQWVSESELCEAMWLKPEEIPTNGRSKKVVPNRIYFYMKDISYLDLKKIMEALCKQRRKDGIQIEWDLLFYDRQIEIVLKCQVEKIEVPFKIVIRPIWQREAFPEKGEYQSLFSENEKVIYRRYPMEMNLAEYLYEILDKLELLGSMQPYGGAYRILSTHPVEGRKIVTDLEEILKKNGLTSIEERWEIIKGYEEYTYMAKRWNKYGKENNMKEVEWNAVIKILNEFFTPVWESIQQNRIFLGDWMPNLGRYLY